MQGLLYISPQEILKGREVKHPLSQQMKENLDKLLVATNRLRVYYGKPLIVSSGYRPGEYNERAKGAPNSAHLTCEAVDFRDPDRELARWILNNTQVLFDCGLYLEDPQYTPTWVHVQIRKPPSGQLVFKPGTPKPNLRLA